MVKHGPYIPYSARKASWDQCCQSCPNKCENPAKNLVELLLLTFMTLIADPITSQLHNISTPCNAQCTSQGIQRRITHALYILGPSRIQETL